MAHFFCRFLSVCLLASVSSSAMELSPLEANLIGKRIFFNECGSKNDRLVWWNAGENFASLGIGHFIWYPEGTTGPFEETFPSLVAFLLEQGEKVPEWISSSCPWGTKEEFSKPDQKTRRLELQELLSRTFDLQAKFIGKRFEIALPKILAAMNDEIKESIEKKVKLLEMSPKGKFALIDYLNFKGDGTLETECYQGKGWGLKQVLEEMPTDTEDPIQAFTETAKKLLKLRVKNSPEMRHEERWLPGWLARVDRYLKS